MHWLDVSQKCWPHRLGWKAMRIQDREGRKALCLLGRRSLRRHAGLIGSNVIALNQSLDPAWDQVFIEYNGFSGTSGASFADLLNDLLNQLSRDSAWDELRLAGLKKSDSTLACRIAEEYGLKARVFDQRPSFARNLLADRSQGTVLGGLSANTRSQIRRSRRLMESTHGPVQLDCARSAQEALTWFEAIEPWHRQRWGAQPGRIGTSGFQNPAFIHFHQTLIRSAFADRHIRIWRLSAGARVVAWLYNFRWDSTEAFYLGAWDPNLDPAMRAGLVAHQMVMDQCLEEGIEIYDFMAGDSQYKRQLANQESELIWLVLQRPRLKFCVEDRVRSFRDRWRTSGSAPSV